jgi:hypothetical protein
MLDFSLNVCALMPRICPVNRRTSLACTRAAVVRCQLRAAKESRPYLLSTPAAYVAIGMSPLNPTPMPLENACIPGTPLDAQYASARRLRYMLPVQIKWILLEARA